MNNSKELLKELKIQIIVCLIMFPTIFFMAYITEDIICRAFFTLLTAGTIRTVGLKLKQIKTLIKMNKIIEPKTIKLILTPTGIRATIAFLKSNGFDVFNDSVPDIIQTRMLRFIHKGETKTIYPNEVISIDKKGLSITK